MLWLCCGGVPETGACAPEGSQPHGSQMSRWGLSMVEEVLRVQVGVLMFGASG